MKHSIETVTTYDNNAALFKKRYDSVGPRIAAIELGSRYIQTNTPVTQRKAIEVGCATGRDAIPLSERFAAYFGFDPAKRFIDTAKSEVAQKHPNVTFSVADALSYDYPPETDAIFAFASLHHLDRDELTVAFRRQSESLKSGGILLATIRESDIYEKVIMDNEHGEQGKRTFYYYPSALVEELGNKAGLRQVFLDHPDDPHPTIPGETLRWLRIVLRKEN